MGPLREQVAELASKAASTLEANLDFEPEGVSVYDYSFGRYVRITREAVDTILYVARREGIVLDLVYTAKAFHGLLDLADKGVIEGEHGSIHTHRWYADKLPV